MPKNHPKYSPKFVFIILNWNGKDDTLECLSSLENHKYPNYAIIVADNGSTDDSVKAVRSKYPNVFVLENGSNLGFAEGNNRAIGYALDNGAEGVVLLNNDVVVDPYLLQNFYDAYRSITSPGIIGATGYYYDKPDTIWAAGGMWDSEKLELSHIGQGKSDKDLPSQKPYEVDYALGCALFVHKDVISKVGLMEPLFFLNFEENDWCMRAKQAGLINYSIPSAKIWHKVSSTFGGESPLWKYYMTRNQLLWSKRNLPSHKHRALIIKTVKEYLPTLFIPSLKSPFIIKQYYWSINLWFRQLCSRFSDPFYQAQYYGVIHYFTNKFGQCPNELMIKLNIKY